MPPTRLVLIADGFTTPGRADRAVTAARSGVRWIHLRDHRAGPDAFEEGARELIPRLQAISTDLCVSVNMRLDVARELGVNFHMGRRGPSVRRARRMLGAEALIGYSAHEDVEARSDRTRSVDYFFFSPIFPTPSKPDHPGTGIPALRTFCEAARPLPVYALGGITPDRVADCRTAGAYGVAVLSGIMGATAPAAAARAYLRALAAPV